MKLGIKVSLERDSAQEIIATHPSMAEVWFNATKPDDYSSLFSFMRTQPMDVGLHYWGTLPNGLLTNIAYPDPTITLPSLALMRATIDIAARNHFSYVNIHTDMQALLNVNFQSMKVSIASEPADINVCTENYLKNVTTLKTYADSRGIVLTVETVPQRDSNNWSTNRNRMHVMNPHQLPIDVQLGLASSGFAIANDFGHTACNLIFNDRDAIWQFLLATTKRLAAATRLIHLSFIVPPYNGVDFHNTLANPLLNSDDAVPNKQEMIKLLKLFGDRDDVWILVEPASNHVENYFLAREILEKAGVLTE